MVSIEKKQVNKKTYYYLEQSYRKDGKVCKKTKYLGAALPKNLETLKSDFLTEYYKETWFPFFDEIKTTYARERRTFPSAIAQKDLQQFATTFTYATNRIEGSTLTLKETADLLEHGLSPLRRPLEDVKEAETHKAVFLEMLHYQKELNLSTILHWHKNLFSQTKEKDAGTIRSYQVGISGSTYKPPYPVELDFLLHEFFNWYRSNKRTMHPVRLAALAHLKLVTIHPFGDGNGRVSRLLMNYILQNHGYPMLIIDYAQRKSYYTALEHSQLKKDDSVFVVWFFKRYLKEYKQYIKKV